MILEEVELPEENIVGGPEGWNEGWRMLAGRALDVERLEITAVAFGIAQAAMEEAQEEEHESRTHRSYQEKSE